MRCQRVRYYLSAYCKGELAGGRRKALAAHLERCPDCQREEMMYREVFDAATAVSQLRVSADFNARLLNRMAAERFQETRAKAYFPKRIPVMTWTRAIPAVATVCLVVAFAFTGGLRYFKMQSQDSGSFAINADRSGTLDDSYLTAQPQSTNVQATPTGVMSGSDANWAFSKQMARVNRFRGLIYGSAGTPAGAGYVRMMDNPFSVMIFNFNGGIPVELRSMPNNNAVVTSMVKEAR